MLIPLAIVIATLAWIYVSFIFHKTGPQGGAKLVLCVL